THPFSARHKRRNKAKESSMNSRIKTIALTIFRAGGLSPAAHAQTAATTTIPIAKCTLTGPGVAVCGGILVAGNELLKLMQGKDALGPNGEVIKAANTAWHDLTKGPGDHNDIVGRHGWLRSRLRFLARPRSQSENRRAPKRARHLN